MHRFLFLFAVLFCPVAAEGLSSIVKTPRVEARMIADVTSVRPGGSFRVGIHIRLEKGWHTYWTNPGDAGQPIRVDWEPSSFVTFGSLQFPTPNRIPEPPFVVYGYEDEAVFLAEAKASDLLGAEKNVLLKANARWLVCREVCIPERGEWELVLPVTSLNPVPFKEATLWKEAAKRIPKDWTGGEILFESKKDGFKILVKGLPAMGREPIFFPLEPGLIENAADQSSVREGEMLILHLKKSPALQKDPAKISGVLAIGEISYRIEARRVTFLDRLRRIFL